MLFFPTTTVVTTTMMFPLAHMLQDYCGHVLSGILQCLCKLSLAKLPMQQISFYHFTYSRMQEHTRSHAGVS